MNDSADTSGLRQRILNYLGIREGELQPTVLLMLQLMLGIASVICLKAASDSLFLSRFEARHLPYADLAVTGLVGVVVGYYIRLSARWPLNRLITVSQLFLAGNLLLFWVLLRQDVFGAPALLYVWVGTFAILIPSQVWSMAGTVFDTRQAKRLFSLIGAGGIIGAALGGEFASIVGPRIGTENILLGTVAFVLGCVGIGFRLSSFRTTAPAGGDTGVTAAASFRETFRSVRNNRYLMLITLAVALSTIAGTMIKYQFKAIARLHYADQPEALTAFFGDFYGYIAVVSFLFHLLATGRLLRWLGLGLTLLILPSSILLGATVLLFSTSLAAGILARGGDQAFRHSLDRASVELLYVPLARGLRARVKGFVDMVVARWADGVASVLLALLNLVALGLAGISWANLFIVALWLLAVWQLRREYVRTLRSSIERKDISAENLLRQLADSAPRSTLELTLQSSDQRAVETAVDWMQFGGASAGQAQLAALLTHESEAIRRKTMAVITSNAIPGRAKEVLRFLELEHDIESRWQAFTYLEQEDRAKATAALQHLLDNADRGLAAAAAARLLHNPAYENSRAAKVFYSYIDGVAAAGASSRATAARLLGLAPAAAAPEGALARFLRDEDPQVVWAALESVAELRLEDEVPTLLGMLTDRRLRRQARRSLAAYGEPLLDRLSAALADTKLDAALRRQVPRVMSAIGGPQAAHRLLSALDGDSADNATRYQILRALVRIRREQPGVPFDAAAATQRVVEELRRFYQEAVLLDGIPATTKGPGAGFLRRALRERLDERINSAFQLLALIYPYREILDAHHWIVSGRPDLRSNALEFLDSRLAHPTRELLLPAVEDRGSNRIAMAAEQLMGVKKISYNNALPLLLDMHDPWLRACAVYVVGEERRFDLRASIERLAANDDPLVAETAALAQKWLRTAAADASDRAQ